MEQEILGQFRRLRRRHLRLRGWDLFLEAAFIMTVTAGAILLLDRLAFEAGIAAPHLSTPEWVAAVLAGALALSAGVSAAALLLRPTPPSEIARRLDRAVGGEERCLSALEFAVARSGGPFAEAVCRDAARVARQADPSKVLPRPPVGYRWAVLLSLVAGGALFAFPPRLYEAPLADFIAEPARGAAPLEVSFRDGSIGAIDDFEWDFGDGATGSGERAAHVFEKPGRHAVRLRLRGPGGTSEKTREIEILDPGQAAADFDAEPRKGRMPLEVRFLNRSQNAGQFVWDFGDGITSRDAEPVHRYESPGLYTVKLKAVNDLGADERVREKFVKVVHPDEPLADFRALPREGEAPLEVYFEDMSSGGLEAWEWDFGDVRAGPQRTSTERNPAHVYTSPGHYTVLLKVKGPHGEDVEEKTKYIRVKSEGEGKGGGGGADSRASGGGGSGMPGRQEGPRTDRPQVEVIPEGIRSHDPGDDLIEKGLMVVDLQGGSEGKAQEVPVKKVLSHYRRAAEDAIGREHVPPALRDYVRRCYEGLRRE